MNHTLLGIYVNNNAGTEAAERAEREMYWFSSCSDNKCMWGTAEDCEDVTDCDDYVDGGSLCDANEASRPCAARTLYNTLFFFSLHPCTTLSRVSFLLLNGPHARPSVRSGLDLLLLLAVRPSRFAFVRGGLWSQQFGLPLLL